MANPTVTIELENGGVIVAELYPETAPNTVRNFAHLVSEGFYDGLIFHRIIPGFMIQGGCPQGTGTGGPGWTIAGEFDENDFDNPLRHERGVLSMARTSAPDSAGSQFFIMHDDAGFLDGSYAAFGKVISGIESVDMIAEIDRDRNDRPLLDQKMLRVTLDTNGEVLAPPEKMG